MGSEMCIRDRPSPPPPPPPQQQTSPQQDPDLIDTAFDFAVDKVDPSQATIDKLKAELAEKDTLIKNQAQVIEGYLLRLVELEGEVQDLKDKQIMSKVSSDDPLIVKEILGSDEKCNHYTAFTSLSRLRSVFEFLNAGPNGQNVILYQNQGKKEIGVADPGHSHHSTPSF